MAEPVVVETPNVHHVFNGGLAIQETTHHRRMQIRDLIVALQRDIQGLVGEHIHVKITADIKISTTQEESNEHSYHVHAQTIPAITSLNDSAGNGTSINSIGPNDTGFLTAREQASPTTLSRLSPLAWRESRPARHSSLTRHLEDQEHAQSSRDIEDQQRPSKRPCTKNRSADFISYPPKTTAPRTTSVACPLTHDSHFVTQRSSNASSFSTMQADEPPDSDEVMSFLRDWRKHWHSQGGWMYDQLTRVFSEDQRQSLAFNGKLDSLQLSIPAASNEVLVEMRNISQKMIPWLEQCRKTSADVAQAREEKWRTSSATFHDQNRRDRDAAEQNMLAEMNTQKSMLSKQMKMMQKLLDSQDSLRHGKEEGPKL